MNTQKPFPSAMNKTDFVQLYLPFSKVILMQRINQIIYDFRKEFPENKNKHFTKIVKTHTITKPEMIEYSRTYFFPTGYYDDEEKST